MAVIADQHFTTDISKMWLQSSNHQLGLPFLVEVAPYCSFHLLCCEIWFFSTKLLTSAITACLKVGFFFNVESRCWCPGKILRYMLLRLYQWSFLKETRWDVRSSWLSVGSQRTSLLVLHVLLEINIALTCNLPHNITSICYISTFLSPANLWKSFCCSVTFIFFPSSSHNLSFDYIFCDEVNVGPRHVSDLLACYFFCKTGIWTLSKMSKKPGPSVKFHRLKCCKRKSWYWRHDHVSHKQSLYVLWWFFSTILQVIWYLTQ